MKKFAKLGCIGSTAVLFVVGCFACFVGGIAFAHWTYTDVTPSEYASVHLGDSRQSVEHLQADDRFILLGQLSRVNGKAIWIEHHVQGGPVLSELSESELDQNKYLKSSGYSYPSKPVPHELFVFVDRESPNFIGFEYVYFLLDESGTVVMIYLGSS